MITSFLKPKSMNYFLQAHFKSLIVGGLVLLSLTCVCQPINFKTLYGGKNLYVQNTFAPPNPFSPPNPFFPNDTVFCTSEVYLNGVKVMENIRSSAYEIDLSDFKLNDTVFAVIKHKQGCKPKMLNPGLYSSLHTFHYKNVFISNDSFNIETKGETGRSRKGNFFYTDTLGYLLDNSYRGGTFYIEKSARDKNNKHVTWQIIDSFSGKNSEAFNSYKFKITKLSKGINLFRIKWVASDGQVFYSTVIEYIKKRK
jgi:hypothetical protein